MRWGEGGSGGVHSTMDCSITNPPLVIVPKEGGVRSTDGCPNKFSSCFADRSRNFAVDWPQSIPACFYQTMSSPYRRNPYHRHKMSTHPVSLSNEPCLYQRTVTLYNWHCLNNVVSCFCLLCNIVNTTNITFALCNAQSIVPHLGSAN